MWLENLIFGTSLKCRPYPSKLKCQKAHCTTNCENANFAQILSEKKLSKISLIKTVFPDDLRISLWYKLVGRPRLETYNVKIMAMDRCIVENVIEMCENEREVFEIYKCVVDIFKKDVDQKEINNDKKSNEKKIDVNKIDENKTDEDENKADEDENKADKDENNSNEIKDNTSKSKSDNMKSQPENIEDGNLKKDNFSNDIINNQKNSNNNVKNTTNTTDSDDIYDIGSVISSSHQNTLDTLTTNNLYTSDDVDLDLLILINYILKLPNCTKNLGYSILYTMFDRFQFDLIYFSSTSYNHTSFADLKKKITQLIKTDQVSYLFDRMFIYGPTSLLHIMTRTKNFNNKSIDNACKQLNIKEIVDVADNDMKEEYFDFLVVQNEVARAQECVKAQLVSKIEELSEKNKELEMRNMNLKKNVENLEDSIKSYETQYVNEIKAMLVSVRNQNEHLQKENESLKKQI